MGRRKRLCWWGIYTEADKELTCGRTLRDNFGERGKGHFGDKGRISEGHTGVMDGERQKASSMQRILQIRVERKATQMTSRGPMGEKQLEGKTAQSCLLTDEEGRAAVIGPGCSRCSIRVMVQPFSGCWKHKELVSKVSMRPVEAC